MSKQTHIGIKRTDKAVFDQVKHRYQGYMQRNLYDGEIIREWAKIINKFLDQKEQGK